MRLDKYLKISRLIKRRTVAKQACEEHRVLVNDKNAKPGLELSIGDVISIEFGSGVLKVKVEKIEDNIRKENAPEMYSVIE